jgi:hypothetical protein
MKAMHAAPLKDEELAFLIQVGRIIRQCRLANQNAALLDQLRGNMISAINNKTQPEIDTQESVNALTSYKRWLKPLR